MHRGWTTQLALVMALGIGSTGCLAIGSAQTAQTIGKGNYEISIDPGVWGAAAGGAVVPTVSMNFAFRFGINERFDLGGRVGTTLAELQTKILLSDPANENFALSLAPAIGGFGFGTSVGGFGVLSIPVPVLIGFKFGQHELTIGPRIQNLMVFGSAGDGGVSASTSAYVFLGGASLGFAAQVTERFRMLPEVAVAFPLFSTASTTATAGSASTSSSSSGYLSEVGALLFMGNLGFQITSPRKKPGSKAKEPPPAE